MPFNQAVSEPNLIALHDNFGRDSVLIYTMVSLATVALAFVSAGFVAAVPQATVQDDDDTFFSGSVDEVTPESLTVTREVLGNPAEHRTFTINALTKVEGKLAEGVRVTVKFRNSDDGLVAEKIIVREPLKTKKK